jgi:hypothetical protein
VKEFEAERIRKSASVLVRKALSLPEFAANVRSLLTVGSLTGNQRDHEREVEQNGECK